jgi:alpha-galactosidase
MIKSFIIGCLFLVGGQPCFAQRPPRLSADTLAFANDDVKIVFNRVTGQVSYRFAGGVRLDNTVASIVDVHSGYLSTIDCRRHRYIVSDLSDRWGRGKKITLEHWGNPAGLVLVQHIYLYDRQPYLLVDLEAHAAWSGARQPETRDISPLAVVPSAGGRLFVPGSEPRILDIPFDNDDWVNDVERRWPSPGADSGAVSGISYELSAVYDNASMSGIVMGSVSHDFWKTGIAYRAAAVSGVLDSLKIFGGVATADDPARRKDYGGMDGTHDHAPHGTMSGATVRSPLVYIAAAADVRKLFTGYGEINARINGRLSWKGDAPVYWNSFGVEDVLGMRHTMMPPDVRTISDSLQSLHHFSQYSPPVLSIDSYDQGIYSTAVLDSISQYGNARGQLMGFYFTPFSEWTWKSAIDHDKLTGTHYALREVVLKDSSGRPIQYKEGDFGAYALDPTHPAVRESIIRQLEKARAIHARFLKIDFLTAGALESPAHFDPSVRSGIQAYNRGMRMLKHLIDSILGPDIFITQAISPLFPSQYAHTRFVSTDVYSHLRNDQPGFPDWGSTEASLATGSHMWWVQGTLWPFTNLDVIIMTHFQRNPVLSEKEVKVRLYAMMVMGSILGDGSDLREPLAMQRARKFLDDPRVDAWFRHPRVFTPLRWADGDSQDQQLAFVLPGDTALVALFNFSGQQEFRETLSLQDLGLKPGKYTIRDFITDEAVGTIAAGQPVFSLAVAEKDALLVRLVPDGGPGQ